MENERDLYVGLISGTSMDGIDAALVRFGAKTELLGAHLHEFPAALRQEMLALARPTDNEIDRLGMVDAQLGRLFAEATLALLAKAGVAPSAVRAIGSHGQTLRHRPGLRPPFTLQVADPNLIAVGTGIPVVADFRRMDMALGGQGAPLVPAFHEAIFREPGRARVVVNIGGIANLTALLGDGRPVIGYDTGPGNTLLDAWCRRVLGEPMDRGGALAARGRVVPALLEAFLTDPYFAQPAPKSTGPEYFTPAWLDRHLAAAGPLAEADVQATLLVLTARSIAAEIRRLAGASRPEVFICGGGAHNAALMAALRTELAGCTVEPTDALGVPVDWVEAMAFAWLAHQRMEGRPGNCPAVTGAQRPAVLGGVYLPG